MWWARLLNVISGLLSGAGAPASTNSYESIATTSLGGTQATITFSSIPSTYKHLQIRILGRTNRASQELDVITATFNSDTAANYSEHWLTGNGTAASAAGNASTSGVSVYRLTGSTAGSNTFGVIVLDILDYADTNKYKTTRNLGGYDNNGSGQIYLGSGNWRSTSAINRIDLTPIGSFVQYSQAALYGIKG